MADHKRRHNSQSSDASDSASPQSEYYDRGEGSTTAGYYPWVPSQPPVISSLSWPEPEVRPTPAGAMEPTVGQLYGDLRTMSRRSSKKYKMSARKCRSQGSHMPPGCPPGSPSDGPREISDSNIFGYGMGFTPIKTSQKKKMYYPLSYTPGGEFNISGSNGATATVGAGGPVQLPSLCGGLDPGLGNWDNIYRTTDPSKYPFFKGLSVECEAVEPKGHSKEDLERMAHMDLALYTLKLQDDIKGMREDTASLRTDLDRMRMEIMGLRGMVRN